MPACSTSVAAAAVTRGASPPAVSASPASTSRPAAWRARDRVAARDVRYVEQDMRQPFGTNAFDLVFSLFTSFGYFEDARDHSSVIGNIAAALTGGGTLVLDYLNAHHVERHLVASEEVSRGEVVYKLTRWSTAQAFFKRIEIHDSIAAGAARIRRARGEADARGLSAPVRRARPRDRADLRRLPLTPFDAIESPRLILVAAKRSARIRSAPARQAFADAAQRLGSDAEIRGQHGLRNAPHDRGIGREELQVSLLGGGTERADDPLILRSRVTLQSGAERGGISGHVVDQPQVRRRIDQQQLGVFDRVDEVLRGVPLLRLFESASHHVSGANWTMCSLPLASMT